MGTFIGIIVFMALTCFAGWCKWEYEKMVVKEAMRELSTKE